MRTPSLFSLMWLALAAGSLGCGSAESVDAVEGVRKGATVKTGVNTCPTFTFYMVLPKRVRGDEVATVIAVASDAQSSRRPLTYVWTATSGTFSRTDSSLTEYRCGDRGPQVLEVTASDQNGCDSVLNLDVECDAP